MDRLEDVVGIVAISAGIIAYIAIRLWLGSIVLLLALRRLYVACPLLERGLWGR